MKKFSLGLAIWLAFFAVVRSARATDILSEPPMRVAEDEEYEVDANGDIPAPPTMDGDIKDEEVQQQQIDNPPPSEE